MRKGMFVPESEFPVQGYCDVDRIYDGKEVRCQECGRKFRFTISRERGPSGYHEVTGLCGCGKVQATGVVDLQLARVERRDVA